MYTEVNALLLRKMSLLSLFLLNRMNRTRVGLSRARVPRRTS